MLLAWRAFALHANRSAILRADVHGEAGAVSSVAGALQSAVLEDFLPSLHELQSAVHAADLTPTPKRTVAAVAPEDGTVPRQRM